MAPYNKIISKKAISTIVKDGQTIVISAATKTSAWDRPSFLADRVGALLTNSVKGWGEPLPAGTEEVCSRETDHWSDIDTRDHITAVCYDANGKAVTVHVPIKRN